MKLNDALVETLLALDVRYVFGVSGANIEHLHDAIHRRGQGRLRSVMARSESGAAFMADGYARVHRRLGVCCATSGGGMLNLLVGVAESYAESVPVLAVVGQPPLSLHGRGAFQDSSGVGHTLNAVQLWSAASKFTAQLTRAEEFWPTLRRALRAALTGRPGPAVLLIPRDVHELEVGDTPPDWGAWLEEVVARPPPVAPERVEPLLEALRAARAPVLVLGHGVRRSPGGEQVAGFALATGLPVATTLSSRGDFPNDAPGYLGTVGVAGHPSVHEYLEREADLLVFAGTGLNVMTRGPISHLLTKKDVFFVNVDCADLAANYRTARFLEADAGEAFRALRARQASAPLRFSPPRDYARRVFRPLLASGQRAQPGAGGLLQSHALALLKRVLPREGHLVYDAGNCSASAMHYGIVPTGTSSTIALGMGGMGYAVGAAIGAQLGSAGARTVAFVGDGAFLMSGLEIHTAVEHGLPILYVIFNNGGHGMCVTRQKLYFEGRVECATYPAVDIARLSSGMGGPEQLWVGRASSAAELEQRMEEYLARGPVPGVLELLIGEEELPPFTPFLPRDAPTVAFSGQVKQLYE
ncbi:MAG TPA: thiamine pyrophosphate-binding protein [Myxococcaceae bacterium]|nr:thiamine pyrophosphate-binding protein [Myxococcaceae bacterium]